MNYNVYLRRLKFIEGAALHLCSKTFTILPLAINWIETVLLQKRTL